MKTKAERDELRRVASAATPGPWLQPIEDEPRLVSDSGGGDSLLGIIEKTGEAIVMERADADYIAAANPQTVLALLDSIEELEGLAQYAAAMIQYRLDTGRLVAESDVELAQRYRERTVEKAKP